MSDEHTTNYAKEDPSPSPRACRAGYRSVADLCADHENLREYIAQLERERDAFGDELAARDKKDRAERVESGTFRHQLIEVSRLLDAAGIRTHWDRTSGISVATRVKMLIERNAVPPQPKG